MAHDEEQGNATATEHHDHHHEVTPNPDYDGPAQHCLPPDVSEGVGWGFYFVILMVAVILFVAWLGSRVQ